MAQGQQQQAAFRHLKCCCCPRCCHACAHPSRPLPAAARRAQQRSQSTARAAWHPRAPETPAAPRPQRSLRQRCSLQLLLLLLLLLAHRQRQHQAALPPAQQPGEGAAWRGLLAGHPSAAWHAPLPPAVRGRAERRGGRVGHREGWGVVIMQPRHAACTAAAIAAASHLLPLPSSTRQPQHIAH